MSTLGSLALDALSTRFTLYARRVIEDRNGLGTNRPGGLGEAKQLVETNRALEVIHATRGSRGLRLDPLQPVVKRRTFATRLLIGRCR